ncbi:ejaculatory bulb-specific protein 3-like isoform X1 [Pararge aegeria]|uniref:Jg14746 protein n=1 Tax=Pararge aegeria aegeria TaxID=348720 RepID=A0A8S4SJ63_9NEOP|nr:ejaculatory bulb-specific protein 3-like isoform X1 [Pararge aegeria]CAH2267279.1 jg14746 [Pararge aegeria aegeria]
MHSTPKLAMVGWPLELSKLLRHSTASRTPLEHSRSPRSFETNVSRAAKVLPRNHNKSGSFVTKVKVLSGIKMQVIYIFVLCTVAATFAAETARPAVSDTALEDALNDKRFIQRQLKCALGEAPCDPIGKRLKTLAPLVLRGACPQCSSQETQQIQRTLSYVQRNYPQQWAKLVRQYSG